MNIKGVQDTSVINMVDIGRLLGHRLTGIAAFLCVALGIAATLWWAFVFFAFGPEPLPVEALPESTTRGIADVPIDRVVAMNLFGTPTTDAAPKTETLSETKLSLVLHGVFVADEPAASTALISQRGNNPRLLTISDRLPGNARLEEVHPDRVVISRGGVRENLSFDRKNQIVRPGNAARAPALQRPRSSVAAPRPARPDRRDARSLIERTLAKHRDEIDRNPGKFIESLGLKTSERGGYVLGTFADNDAGLEPGDRLLSLNGKPVGNLVEDRAQLERILAGRAVDIQIQRGEQLITFELSLGS